jgi:hypothetical protein
VPWEPTVLDDGQDVLWGIAPDMRDSLYNKHGWDSSADGQQWRVEL